MIVEEPRYREMEIEWDNDMIVEEPRYREIEIEWDNDDMVVEEPCEREIEVYWNRDMIVEESHHREKKDTLCYSSKKYTTKPVFSKDDMIQTHRLMYYVELLHIPLWRNKLHDSWMQITSPFVIDNLSYATIYHYYHREKFLHYPLFSHQFCLESNSLLSVTINLAISAGSLTGYFGKKQIRTDNIHPTRFSSTEKKEIRRKALFAKFSQIESLRYVLLCTLDSVLMDKTSRIIDNDLMEIRSIIRAREV